MGRRWIACIVGEATVERNTTRKPAGPPSLPRSVRCLAALLGALTLGACDDDASTTGTGGASGGSGAPTGPGPGAAQSTTAATTSATSTSDVGAGGGGQLGGLEVRLEAATPEQIAVYAPVTGSVADDARVGLRYRVFGTPDWRDAMPLFRIHPEWSDGGGPEPLVDAFGGTIFDLAPGTTYDLELTLRTPGQPDTTLVTTASTRALPPASGSVTRTVTPADDLQAALLALGPGDVLELGPGTYDVDGLYFDSEGTAAAPIVVRGASRPDVVLSDPDGAVLQLRKAAHVVFENLTLQGSGVDSGTDASSIGVTFWDGESQELVTFRGLDIRGVDMGIVAWAAVRNILVYDCDLHGNNVWQADYLHTNLTWNDDGIRVPGQGNAVFENTLDGFGDSFAVVAGALSASVFFYRNVVTMTGDDAFEGDYATRNVGFYDNYIENSGTFVSLDPLYGGPLYGFRNVSINTFRGPFKLNNTNSSFLFASNTMVRTEGRTGWGWAQSNNGELRNFSYRNNLLVYRGASGDLLALESGGCDPVDFTHNAWFPDGSVWWTSSGASYATLSEAIAGAGQPATKPVFGDATARHAGDVVSERDPFVTPIELGADHLTLFTAGTEPTLRPGTAPKNAGTPIPNVTDGFTGSAPDIGAVIEGRTVPRRGAIR